MNDLITDLKVQIATQLKIKNIGPEDIGDDEPLFGDGLGFDSLDALELIVLLKQKYGVKVTAEEGPKIFRSVKTIAEYITAKRSPGA